MDSYLKAILIPDPLRMSCLAIWRVITSGISSQVSDYGLARFISPDMEIPEGFAQALALASLSPPPARSARKKTSDTFTPNGAGSSASAAFQLLSANRLAARLPWAGWMQSRMTWKIKRTPSGRQYCQLQVSGSRTSATDCSLWVSPTARGGSRGTNPPRPQDTGLPLSQQIGQLAAFWSTPQAMDALEARSPEAMQKHMSTARKGRAAPGNLREQVVPAMWPTPVVPNGGRTPKGGAMTLTGQTPSGGKRQVDLNFMVRSLWPTPAAQDRKGGNREWTAEGAPNLSTAVLPMSNGLRAPTENTGQLNPEFSFWLMGIPNEWAASMQRGMASTRKSRRNSSKPD